MLLFLRVCECNDTPGNLCSQDTAIVVRPMAIAWSPTVARMVARTAQPVPVPPQSRVLRLPGPHLPRLLVNPCLESLQPLLLPNPLERSPPTAAVALTSATLSAATGPRVLAAPCTDTVVTPHRTAVRDASRVLAPTVLLSPLPRPAQPLRPRSPVR